MWNYLLVFKNAISLSYFMPFLMLSHTAWDVLLPISLSGEHLLTLQDVPQSYLLCGAPLALL